MFQRIFSSLFLALCGVALSAPVNNNEMTTYISFSDGQIIKGNLLELSENKKILWKPFNIKESLEFNQISPSTTLFFANKPPFPFIQNSTKLTLIDGQIFWGKVTSLSQETLDFETNGTTLKFPLSLLQSLYSPNANNPMGIEDFKSKLSQIGYSSLLQKNSNWTLKDNTLICEGSGILNIPLGKRSSCIIEFLIDVPNSQKDLFALILSQKDHTEGEKPVTDKLQSNPTHVTSYGQFDQINEFKATFCPSIITFPISSEVNLFWCSENEASAIRRLNHYYNPNLLPYLQNNMAFTAKVRFEIDFPKKQISLQIDDKIFMKNSQQFDAFGGTLNLHLFAATNEVKSQIKIRNLIISECSYPEKIEKTGSETLRTSKNEFLTLKELKIQDGKILAGESSFSPNEIINWTRNLTPTKPSYPQIELNSGEIFSIQSAKAKENDTYLLTTPFGEISVPKKSIARIVYSGNN